MLRFDAVGETCMSFGGPVAPDAVAAAAASTIALAVHDYRRAGVLGSATLLAGRAGPLLVTAAHLFDDGVRLGNVLAPLEGARGFITLAGARLHRAVGADIALVDLARVVGAARLLEGRRGAAWPRAGWRRPHGARMPDRVLVCGYPAAMSRFERGWLAARRLALLTVPHKESREGTDDRLFDYGRVAQRVDGTPIRTPELQGMSGAGIWSVAEGDEGGARLVLDAVQSAFVHGRHVRGVALGAAGELFEAWQPAR